MSKPKRNGANSTERLSRNEKEAQDFQWYREKIDMYDSESQLSSTGYGGVDEYKRMSVNYDLFNDIINVADFDYVAKPYGEGLGEMPANLTNKDISSYRIKAMMGMEMRRPFGYRLLATNKEASNRKMEEENNRITKYVLESVMAPIKAQAEAKYQEQLQGKKLTQQQVQEIQAKIQEEIEANTPDKVRMYMKRDHRDPAEVQGQQILNGLIKKLDIRKKFNLGWKHALLSAYEIYWIGIVNGEPTLKVINPLRFACDKSSDTEYIEDGEWARAEYRMHPSQVIQTFDLSNDEIDEVWSDHTHNITQRTEGYQFNFGEAPQEQDDNCVRVIHVVFKGLRKVGWLDYLDEDGILQTKFMVDEGYTLNEANGDVSLTWEWIPEIYEGWKIGANIYKDMKPVAGQFKDKDKIYQSKLPYYGIIYDNTNSQPTAIMDRMKVCQYYHNIIWYRIEMLMASDKGKKIMMNINAIPTDSGIDLTRWQYFFESTPFMWYNPDEEGMTQSDVNTIAKTLDLSLVSDIQKYILLAEKVDQMCGKIVGVTDPVLGQTATSERVANNQQNLVQTSHMLEPYFDAHSSVKKNVLQGLIDLAKIAYINSDKEFITNILDDMSFEMLKLDINLLETSTLALFVEDSSMSEHIKQNIEQLAHAAMQNQKIELSDVLKVLKQDSIQEAEEALLVSEDLREKKNQAIAQQEQQAKAEEAQKDRDFGERKHEMAKEIINLKEDRQLEREIQKQAILSLGFNEDKDMDRDGVPDILEVARDGVNAEIQRGKLVLESKALAHKIRDDKEKNRIKEKELNNKSKAK